MQVLGGVPEGGMGPGTGAAWRRWLSWLLGLLMMAGLALALTLAWATYQAEHKRERVIPIPPYPLVLRDDQASLVRGRYLYDARGCAGCHGLQGQGRVFIDDPYAGLHAAGPHISPGARSTTLHYRPADWERLIRHGVKPDGRPALWMPADQYNRLSDEDLGALVGYIVQMPAVAGSLAELEAPLWARVRYGLGIARDAAAKIDHSLPPQPAVPEAVSLAYGQYLSQSCLSCHSLGALGTQMARYADAPSFHRMMRTGTRPDRSEISRRMPFEALSQMNDLELDALHLYLRTLPAGPTRQ